jgi:hypothetical protein
LKIVTSTISSWHHHHGRIGSSSALGRFPKPRIQWAKRSGIFLTERSKLFCDDDKMANLEEASRKWVREEEQARSVSFSYSGGVLHLILYAGFQQPSLSMTRNLRSCSTQNPACATLFRSCLSIVQHLMMASTARAWKSALTKASDDIPSSTANGIDILQLEPTGPRLKSDALSFERTASWNVSKRR